ncbi:hypothetical protein HMPREF9124_1382 [Oribacterium sp. oral taxon 108 str. F0425]|nr:hypothetical protein HMPREF9124_1382 [Oribacterium sp. oral taxon 108 str. F0425]
MIDVLFFERFIFEVLRDGSTVSFFLKIFFFRIMSFPLNIFLFAFLSSYLQKEKN